MAIKKGAFALYTQERQLPNKKAATSTKSNHFFDDIDKDINGSQSVHNKSTTNSMTLIDEPVSSNKKHALNKQNPELINNQSVTDHLDPDFKLSDLKEHSAQVPFNNGSQLVHKSLNDNLNTSIQVINEKNNNEKLIYSDDSKTTKKVKSLASDREQTPNNTFSKLVGNQRKIVIALYKNMIINKQDTTEALTLDTIASLTGVNLKSLKNTLFRLNNAGVINRSDQKIGRGGWVKYQVSENIISEIQQKELFNTLK